ncbi:MAG: thiol peroxidase [Flavobacteriaceae bacterium]|nr:thiol peroxidase [Flavobacteriaceae bacterium]
MSKITLKGNAINTIGSLPELNTIASDFTLIKNDLSPISLSDLKGKRVVLNIYPSIDTGTCAASTRKFNELASGLDNTTVLCVSRDLPFAQARFCGSEGIENAITVSDFANGDFGKAYGLTIIDGPLANLHSRAIVVLNEKQEVIYTQQVSEIVDEPNYDKVIDVLKK